MPRCRQGEPPQSKLLLRFSAESVDGVDELVIRGRKTRVEHREWDPMTGVDVDVVAAQRPTRENEGELRVRIDDGHAGAAPLSFELWAVATATGAAPSTWS
jgi:hypothetical protein